jgi:caffeoyl-CoA O-methyltransferase
MSTTLGVSEPVRAYIQAWGVREDPVLARCREETKADPRRGMQIAPEQGALMQVLVKALKVRFALEVGVFTGYSSTATALAVKQVHGEKGRLTACDISADFVERARAYWRAAGVDNIITARIGPAAQSLRELIDEGRAGHFDLMFIDADKTGYETYYELGLELLRAGGVVLIDNMLWSGQVADEGDTSGDTVALRALARKIHDDARVDMTLATIGDGLSVIVKR